MIPWVLLAEATFGVFPSPAVPRETIVFSYPAGMGRRDGNSRVQLTYSPEGNLIRCDILVSSGHADLDKASCAAAVGSKAIPARDETGKYTYGTYNVGFTFVRSGKTIAAPPNADLSLVVNQMPEKDRPFSTRLAALLVDDAGRVRTCVSLVFGENGRSPLDRTLCALARSELSLKPARDENDLPVASVQTFSVEFSDASAPLVRPEKLTDPAESGLTFSPSKKRSKDK